MINIPYSKVVIWGYPLYSHTHSYVHYGYYKAFKSMGYDTYWFHDDEYPKDFDFSNCLFIGEGFADKNIPINSTSCYFIMYCPSPIKYVEAKKYVDVRMAAINFEDHIYSKYSVDRENAQKVGATCYYEPKSSKKCRVKNKSVDYEMDDYNKLYIGWATNLLPDEINFDDMYIERENAIYFSGTISPAGECESWSNWKLFIEECSNNGVDFHYNDVWSNPLSFEEVQKQVQKSILGVDIRSKIHIRQRIVPCRVFKNISYGHMGITNTEQIYQEMDGNCIFNSDPAQLFHDGMSNRKNYDMIRKGMQFVKENHTYINRCNSILKIISND